MGYSPHAAQSALRFSILWKMTLIRILILLPPLQGAGVVGMSHHLVFSVLGGVCRDPFPGGQTTTPAPRLLDDNGVEATVKVVSPIL